MKGLPELVIGDLKVKRPVIQGFHNLTPQFIRSLFTVGKNDTCLDCLTADWNWRRELLEKSCGRKMWCGSDYPL